jgi:hypothetical protein
MNRLARKKESKQFLPNIPGKKTSHYLKKAGYGSIRKRIRPIYEPCLIHIGTGL